VVAFYHGGNKVVKSPTMHIIDVSEIALGVGVVVGDLDDCEGSAV